MPHPDFLATLTEIITDLLVPSESDEPLTLVVFSDDEPPTIPHVLTRLGRPADTPVQEADLLRFFEPLMRAEPWHDAEQQEVARRFRALYDLLVEHLQDVRVYRIGEREIDVVILGSLQNPTTTIGLMTRLIET